jgi:hypothetical protein
MPWSAELTTCSITRRSTSTPDALQGYSPQLRLSPRGTGGQRADRSGEHYLFSPWADDRAEPPSVRILAPMLQCCTRAHGVIPM